MKSGFCVLRLLVYVFLCLIGFNLPAALAAEKVELSLREAVDIAVRENLSLSAEKLNRNVSESDIKVKEGEFDPVLKLQASETYRRSPSAYLILSTEQRMFTSEAGLGGKINTGMTYELKWANSRFRENSPFFTLNPYYISELTLTVTQPLLKGLGRGVQESGLDIARNNLEIAKLRLDESANQIISDTTTAYWDLLSARHELEVSEISLRLAKDLLGEVKARIEAGYLAPAEIYKAEAEVALREEALLRNSKLIADAEDNLRTIMNLTDWDREIVPVEKSPAIAEMPQLEAVLGEALSVRRDLRQAEMDRKNKEITRRFYENQQLPDLSLVASTGRNGLAGHYDGTIEGLRSGGNYSWQVGLALNIPLGNRTARGYMLKAKYDEDKAEVNLRLLKQRITVEIREAWRALRLSIESIEATKKTRIAAEKRLDAEVTRFKVGMSTLTDVLKFQEEYARAISSEKDAHVNYAKSLDGIEKVKGTLWKGY